MTTPPTGAVAIREAIFERLSTLPGYTTYRRVLIPQLQVDELPALSVSIISETMTPDGDYNAGPPHFESDTVIGIGVARGFADPLVLDGQIDADASAILRNLLTDPTFVHFGPDALFEGVTQVTRRRVYAQDGQAYFLELRLEMTFRGRHDFEPLVTTPFSGLSMTTKMPGSSGTPSTIQSTFPVQE